VFPLSHVNDPLLRMPFYVIAGDVLRSLFPTSDHYQYVNFVTAWLRRRVIGPTPQI